MFRFSNPVPASLPELGRFHTAQAGRLSGFASIGTDELVAVKTLTEVICDEKTIP
jgi:hypothetical protein